jgi:ribosome-associated protein
MSELLDIVTDTLSKKLARDITVIDMRGVNPFMDYFVICTAGSVRQAGSLADYVEQAAEEHGFEVRSKEGVGDSTWVLIDLNDVVVHIFTEEARKQYRLEALWGDQPQHTVD